MESLINYIKYLQDSSATNDIIGRNVRHVTAFLESGYPVTKRGYNLYKKEELIKIVDTRNYNESVISITDFLSFTNGVRKYRKKKVKTLEKISEISARNQKILKEFNAFLVEKNNFSDHTVRNYSMSIRYFFDYGGDLTKESFRRFVATMEEKGLKPTTIELRVSALNKLALFCKKPDIRIERPKASRRRLNLEEVPSEKEYNIFLEYLQNKNIIHYYWVRILAGTGARVSEFLQFTWEDIEDFYKQLKENNNETK